MARRLGLVLCALLLLGGSRGFDIDLGDVTEVLKFSREVVTDILESYHLIKPKQPGDEENDFPFVKRMEKRLMNHISQVSSKIDAFEGRVEHKTEVVLDAVLEKVPEREALEASMHDLWKYLGQVEDQYLNFVSYAKSPQKFEQYTMEEFAKSSVSPSLNALPDVLKMIHRLVVPPNWDADLFHRSILTLLAKNMQVARRGIRARISMRRNSVAAAVVGCVFALSATWVLTAKLRAKEWTAIDLLRQRVLSMQEPQVSDIDSSGLQREHVKLVSVYKELAEEIERDFPGNLERHLEVLNTLWLWARTQSELRGIDGLYMTYRKMQQDLIDNRRPINLKEWINFARTVLTDPNASVPAALERIADFIVNQRLFVSAYQEANTQICNTLQSPQQLLYNLYNAIALTEIKGYTMMQFSWTLLKLYNKGNFTEEMEQLKQQYAIRTSETLRAIKTAMVFAPRDIWKCDPVRHKLETTYTELKQVFQGYIVNEVDMNPQGTCKENCGYYSYSKVYGCYQNQFCSQQRRCNGKLLNCQYIDSDMWVCPSDKNSNRRYEYIEYENGMTFGPKGNCRRSTTKVDSWWRWLFWHCSYCMCYCDDHNSSSDRYFNLRDVTADIDENKVVTGVRMKKENQIIHIQIQQGVLGPRGSIDVSTVAWKKIDNYTIVDPDVRAGRDYHTIMWEKRAVDLDDLDSPADHLLTGLRFRLVGTHLNLEIQMTPFNFTTGQLIKEKSLWHSHDTTEASEVVDLNGELQQTKKRTELKLNKPDIPTRSLVQSVPDSQTNQFMLFTPSDLGKDAAQSTVPYIDVQPVIPQPPVPISGAGIYHKGRDGYGGFLALKLITYDFEPQLRAELPASPPVIGLSNDVDAM